MVRSGCECQCGCDVARGSVKCCLACIVYETEMILKSDLKRMRSMGEMACLRGVEVGGGFC